MRFYYVAYSLEQGVVRGRVEARDLASATEEVAQKGYKLLRLKAAWQQPTMEQLFPSLFRVGTGELVRFTRQLSIMVRGGGSLQRALELLHQECTNQVMRRVLTSVRAAVDDGGSLSGAVGAHPAVFSPRYVSVVGAGEFTGRLAPALEQLADILEKEHEAKQKAKRTMMMPMFTIGASGIMLVLMLTVLLPPLLDTFERMGASMPLITRMAVGLVGVVRSELPSIVGVMGVLAAGFWFLRRIPAMRLRMHSVQAKLPLLGPITVARELSVFSRTVGMLVEAGVSLTQAIPLAISGCKNTSMKRAFQAGEESLLTGHGLTTGLREHTILPRMWVELITVGEESNSLGLSMNELADAYQTELDTRLGNLLAMLEPASTLVVGAVVLFMALSMFMPLYSGLNALRQ